VEKKPKLDHLVCEFIESRTGIFIEPQCVILFNGVKCNMQIDVDETATELVMIGDSCCFV
jgi:hypothetical protein